MFTPNCRRCPLVKKLTSFVLDVLKSYTLCLLSQSKYFFLLNKCIFLILEDRRG
ncbi:hypothetical protein Hanom_Chr14g01310881 [Helianthus anomalus]